MTTFRIEPTFSDYHAIYWGDRKVAILFPARPYVQADVWPAQQALPWSLMPDPEAFPDAACTGLPRPLSPAGNRFDSFEQVLAFLGLEQERAAA
jgi:hypothetical protein